MATPAHRGKGFFNCDKKSSSKSIGALPKESFVDFGCKTLLIR